MLVGKAIIYVCAFVSVLGFILFTCAGTIQYWEAWVYLGFFGLASLCITLYLGKNDPALLERRMRGGPVAETSSSQKLIQSVAALGFIALLIVPALDERSRWSHLPPAAVGAGDVLALACFYFVFLAFRENTFTSATIQIAPEQRVVSTGPYALVRHPMYAGALLLFIGTPLALGSYWGLLVTIVMLPVLVWRLLDEERFLASNLGGYREYCEKVRWRLLPRVF